MSNPINTLLPSIFLLLALTILSCYGQQDTASISQSDLTFSAPWSQSEYQETHAQLWHTDDTLYFAFQVKDTLLVSITQDNFHKGIGSSDRVELFFSTDTLMTDYYGMEIGYDNRVLSFHGKHYRDIDYKWSWPQESLQTHCSLTDSGYSCKGKLAMVYLDSLNLIDDSKLHLGVFRADYNQRDNPRNVTWITHHKPKTKVPDFHTPTAFFSYFL